MASPTKTPVYQNNPFVIATDGLSLLFKNALPIAIIGIVLSVLGFVGTIPSNFDASYEHGDRINPEKSMAANLPSFPAEAWIAIGVIALIVLIGFIVIGTFISGVFDYTAAQLANNKKVTLGEALHAVASRFFGYLWLQIIVGVKIFLWSLLLIVPGIIMATRYSLSGASFFRHKLGANAATKHSAVITKGAWLTTFGSFGLFNIITLGLIQPLLQPGTSSRLLRQYDAYSNAELPKPPAHGLSWLVLGLVIALCVLTIAFISLAVLLYTDGFSKGRIPALF